ncbi:hypothetical protein [Mesorhizobium sp.]|uniref:hypothetical protein n=1 Tax=Mesorhizobium sp. TaxID=1871066 RepID=UPI0025CEC0EC|nr:hypothetical protein [Mesorhizobium sp.]
MSSDRPPEFQHFSELLLPAMKLVAAKAMPANNAMATKKPNPLKRGSFQTFG